MNLHLSVLNHSKRKHLYRTDVLRRLGERVCHGEKVEEDAELSVLLCDDPYIQELNRTYRKTDVPTDVLSFGQDPVVGYTGPRVLGDIVISLETVERYCWEQSKQGAECGVIRAEVCLLFCHGLLHLVGFDHGTKKARAEMNKKQAEYLGITMEAAWRVRK